MLPRASEEELHALGLSGEFDPEALGRARGPSAGEVANELVHPKRRVSFIRIEQRECAKDAALFRLGEREGVIEKLRREAERLVLDRYRFQRFLAPLVGRQMPQEVAMLDNLKRVLETH